MRERRAVDDARARRGARRSRPRSTARGPSRGARRVAAAPEALEQAVVLGGVGARALVADAEPRRVAAALAAHGDAAAGRAVDEPVLDQVAQRAAQRVVVAVDADRRPGRRGAPGRGSCGRRRARGRARRDAAARARAPPSSTRSSASSSSTSRARRSASWRSSASTSSSAPWRAAYSTLPSSAVTGVRSSCEASARKRRSPARACSSEASIRLSTPVSWPISSAWPALAAAGARDRRCARSPPPPRPAAAAAAGPAASAPPRPARPAARRRRRSARARSRGAWIVCAMSVVSEATSTAPPAAGPPASRDRRRVQPERRPPSSMSSAPVRPCTRAARASAVLGSRRAPRVSERAMIRPRRVDHLDRDLAARTRGSRARPASVSTAGAETASCATS